MLIGGYICNAEVLTNVKHCIVFFCFPISLILKAIFRKTSNCLLFLCQGPLMLHTSKQYPSQDATAFHVFGRVMSGTSMLDIKSDSKGYFEIYHNTLQNAFLSSTCC